MALKELDPETASKIRNSVTSKYRDVAERPEGHFPYTIGKASALKLGYEASWLEAIPEEIVERFVGVGNPFSVHTPQPGESILDAGCGCGMDAFVSSIIVGPSGRVAGMDITDRMLSLPRKFASRFKLKNLEFREASIEALPYGDAAFDVVVSNGALNLVPDKMAAFSELARVLREGGILAVADLLVMEEIPVEVLTDRDAWST
jgi:arsenite methyltransferase